MPLPMTTAIGNLVADAEVSTTTNGHLKAELRLACNDRKKVNGEWVDGETLFIKVTCWDSRAEAVSEMRKGTPVIVTGRINVRQYEKKDGSKGFSTEIAADNIAIQVKAPKAQGQSSASTEDPWEF